MDALWLLHSCVFVCAVVNLIYQLTVDLISNSAHTFLASLVNLDHHLV
jgi:hypothetical protein